MREEWGVTAHGYEIPFWGHGSVPPVHSGIVVPLYEYATELHTSKVHCTVCESYPSRYVWYLNCLVWLVATLLDSTVRLLGSESAGCNSPSPTDPTFSSWCLWIWTLHCIPWLPAPGISVSAEVHAGSLQYLSQLCSLLGTSWFLGNSCIFLGLSSIIARNWETVAYGHFT